MEEKKRHLLIFFALLLVIWGGYFIVKHFAIDRNLILQEDDFSWVMQVDSVSYKNGEVVLTGFSFKLEEDAKVDTYNIVLQDIESGKLLFSKIENLSRTDVNDYFLCEYDYTGSGFIARVKMDDLDLHNKNYEVILQERGKRKAYRTGTFISKGQLMYVNPNEYLPLEVEGTDLEEIVEKGVLRVYCQEAGLYIYQYQEDIYWITDKNYTFIDDNTLVEYQVVTTQKEKLPPERVKYSFENCPFRFTSSEWVSGNVGSYRVARKELPNEYAISKIVTGSPSEPWVWRRTFRPYYSFSQ